MLCENVVCMNFFDQTHRISSGNVTFLTDIFIPGSIMFHVRRRPADSQPRRRKKKSFGVSNGANNHSTEREGPMLIEVTHSGDGGRRIKLSGDPIEVSSFPTH